MKFNVVTSEQGVEIHLHNEDGSVSVWLCDNEQAAVFKLASLIFRRAETPEQAKRSILVGDFEPIEPKREKPLSEKAEEVKKRLSEKMIQKGAIVPSSVPAIPAEVSKELQDLLEKITKTPFVPYVTPGGGLQPSVPNWPYPGGGYDPLGGGIYVGDPIPFPGGTFTVNKFGAVGSDSTAGLLSSMINLSEVGGSVVGAIVNDKPVAQLLSNGIPMTVFKTSVDYKAAG